MSRSALILAVSSGVFFVVGIIAALLAHDDLVLGAETDLLLAGQLRATVAVGSFVLSVGCVVGLLVLRGVGELLGRSTSADRRTTVSS